MREKGQNMNKIYAFIAILLLLTGCDFFGQKGAMQMPTMKELPVSTIIAKKSDVPISFEFPARLRSKQDIIVIAKVPGSLKDEYFKPGDIVKKGDKLFLIDPQKYEAALSVAKANLAVAKANFKRAELDYNRAENLKKNRAISQKEYDAALSNFYITKAQIESAKAGYTNAMIDFGYTSVEAPFDGILGDFFKDIGAYVGLSDPKLVRLTKLNPIEADFSISETDSLMINQKLNSKQWQQIGANATLIVGNSKYQGKVVFIDKVIDKATSSVAAKAEFDNNDTKLLPGSFARIKMSGFYQKDGFKIPQLAIHQDAMGSFVYIIKDAKVAKANVKISYETSEFAVISSGLNDGDKIIMDNFLKLRVGLSVVESKENR